MVLRRGAAVARIAATLVAVTLSGAPRVAAMHAPVEGHRCECRAHRGGHHDCECAVCRRDALAAQASDERAPPCHRAAARKALSRGRDSGSRDAPCLEGRCGASGRPVMTISGVEPFCIPAGSAVDTSGPSEPREGHAGPFRARSVEPETPPPRAA